MHDYRKRLMGLNIEFDTVLIPPDVNGLVSYLIFLFRVNEMRNPHALSCLVANNLNYVKTLNKANYAQQVLPY